MATPIPENPNALLGREATAEALTASGFPTKAKTLATKATRGGGPPFHNWGSRVLYRWSDSLAWAQSRLGERRHSTSELDSASPKAGTSVIAPPNSEAG